MSIEVDRQARRRAIERGQLASPRRRALLHPENLPLLEPLLRAGLRITGLLHRGERNALRPVVRHIRFTFPHLPASFSGFRILHLSDLHADIPAAFARHVMASLRPIEADLCVLTGDYRFHTTGPSAAAYAAMRDILGAVETRCGIVGVLGNHDYGEAAGALERMGVTMLVNHAFELAAAGDRLWLLGVDDPHYYGCDDLPAALAGVPEPAFTILLAHSPELYDLARTLDVDLYLCGHTHGGQICLPLVGPIWLNAKCPRRFTHGCWQHGKMRGYTNAGLGSSMLPVRFNCPPEIALIELQRAAPPEGMRAAG
jgi:predicted MPP superfamily phosphohydrolase